MILLTLNFVTYRPKNITRRSAVCEFQRGRPSWIYEERSTENQLVRVQQFYDGCFMCAHTCCARRHVFVPRAKIQQVCAHIKQPSNPKPYVSFLYCDHVQSAVRGNSAPVRFNLCNTNLRLLPTAVLLNMFHARNALFSMKLQTKSQIILH